MWRGKAARRTRYRNGLAGDESVLSALQKTQTVQIFYATAKRFGFSNIFLNEHIFCKDALN